MWIVVVILTVLVVTFFWSYNSLISIRQLVRNAWADVDVYLKRRAELIPNLVSATKGYTKHEETTFERLASARAAAQQAPQADPQRIGAEQRIGQGATKLIALAESYPELKASENFLSLQQELSETERLIADARQYYNACVRDYNIKLEAFPTSLVAGMLGYKPAEFFEADDRSVPRVSGLS